MPSRYYHLEDDRELDAQPVLLPCDVCSRLYRSTIDDAMDETRLCLRCTLAVARVPHLTAVPVDETDPTGSHQPGPLMTAEEGRHHAPITLSLHRTI
jgi:hypothetical protein